MKRILPLAATLALTLLHLAFAEDGGALSRAKAELIVRIPGKTVMYIESPGGEANRAAPAGTLETVFDLSCATLGAPPAYCQTLYPALNGRLRDTQGRPYPPVALDARGNVSAFGDFPQFFESPSRTLRLYTPSADWRLHVLFVPESESDFGPDHFAVFSNSTGWRCLGSSPAWEADTVCPAGTDAARSAVTVAEVTGSAGGWQEVALKLRLRLDGDETQGSYSGELRYTLVNF